MRENTRIDFSVAPSANRSAFLTYEPYYGLKEKPFSLSADPRFLYKSRAHAPTFDELRAGIRRREGIIVLTGEPGTGKTTLCRAVLEALDRKTFCTMVPDPFVSRDDLLKMLLLDFGVMSVEDLKSGRLNTASRPELSYPLYEFLRSLVPLQAYAVLIIDEAQNLSPQVLEEIRILADLEAPEKLLQLVLVGQPELRAKLKDHSMRQVEQRVSVRVELASLDRDGVGEYIAHRLDVAGGGADRVTFASDALDVIYKATRGNPRLINLACDKALHYGHLARTFIIGPEVVSKSLVELGMLEPSASPAPASTSVPSFVPPPVPSLVVPPAPPAVAPPAPSIVVPPAPPLAVPMPAPAPVPVATAAPASSPAPRTEPKSELKIEPKLEAKPEVRVEPRPEPRHEFKFEPKFEPRLESKPRPEPKLESKNESKSESRPPARFESRFATRLEPMRRGAEPEPMDDFGLGEAFFERQPSADDLSDGDGEGQEMFANAGDAARSSRRRTVLLLVGCVVAPALLALLIWWWQQGPFDSTSLPALPPQPASALTPRTARPPASAEQIETAQSSGSLFEVGVALFSGYDRASTLAVELAAAGFRASTRSIDSAKGRLYEVRTGPYFSQDAAEADAQRIRQIPGYADARVVPPAAAP